MTIHLPQDVETSILAAVQSGRFPSVDAAMTEAASLLLQQLRQADAQQPATSSGAREHKPVWERILERTAAIPDEEWDKLPTDLAEQHDHYLYGTPKRPPA
jgi:Arc/MetJ-type ribon-helix-helix transcriptional regulator